MDPPQADGHCSGRYASYLNAFLFSMVLLHYMVIINDIIM